MTWQSILPVITGFLTAVVVDIRSWRNHPGQPFDWWIAATNWIMGILVGLTGGVATSATT